MNWEDNSKIQQLYKVSEGIVFSECMGCSEHCCRMPEMLKEEHDFMSSKFDDKKFKKIRDTNFILGYEQCIFFNEKSGCEIYKYRPFVCRIFPMDLLEEDGEYWWCIYTTCSKCVELQEKLEPLIPKLESLITRDIFEQYVNQDIVAKEAYGAYKNKQYRKISKFKPSFQLI